MATIPEALTIALQHHQAGRLSQAEAIYRQILQVQPRHPDALHLLGVVAHQMGKHDIGADFIRQAIDLRPGDAKFYNNLGEAYRAQGKLAEAVVHYEKALALRPGYVEAHNNLGNTLKAQGKLAEAAARYRIVLALKPDLAEANNNLGLALQEEGRLAEAIAHYRQALVLKPDLAEAHNNLGLAFQEEGRLAEAMVHYRQALALNPALAEVHNNLGSALAGLGQWTEALVHCRQAVGLRPALAQAHSNLGNILKEQGDFEAAVTCFRQALALNADFAEAHYNLGNTLKEQGRRTEAVLHYKRALAVKPDYAEAENQLMHQLQHLCDWTMLTELFDRQRHIVRTNPVAQLTPFSLLSIPSSAKEQLACARNWVANRLTPIARLREQFGFAFVRTAKPRLRIGYLSADFRRHPVATLSAELFELHDRSRVEIYAYSFGPDDGSAVRQRIVRACDRFVDIRGESFVPSVRRIHADGIDILIDLTGHTMSARTQILALRPAPIQVIYLGYPGTMGADFIDYVITDKFITPPEHEAFFAEKLVYLPDCYQANDRQRSIAEQTPTRQECGLPEAGFVFCCFNSNYKLTPTIFDIWMRLLLAIPGSVLWLLEANPTVAANLCKEATARGVAPERLVFASRLPVEQHLALHRLADLFLDTLPYNGHATCSDALWAGLPVLTCAGETFTSRVAGSLLTAIGLPELITYSLPEYEARALHLARHPSELAEFRDRLAQKRLTAPLFDTPRFTRHLETAYKLMWELYQAGEAPRRIEVPPLPDLQKEGLVGP
jgi:predicted O-linked N-acetylglucosamine transferase (SPINDLY family)